MMLGRIRYRSQQFWNALFAEPEQYGIERARNILTPMQMGLFLRMGPSEQAHSLVVMNKILKAMNTDVVEGMDDLLVAALLHDVGKINHPLRVWERILIVVGRFLFPVHVKRWGAGEPQGWKRAFVIAEQHPEWGAELAASTGASPLSVNLIRRHQNSEHSGCSAFELQLLNRLQLADQDS